MRGSLNPKGPRVKPVRPVKHAGERGLTVKFKANVMERRLLRLRAEKAGYNELGPWARDVLLGLI